MYHRANRCSRHILVLAMALLLSACSDKPSTRESQKKAAPSEQKMARIVFALPGDDIGAPESQQLLETIKAALLAKGIGDIVSSGYGMGTMEIVAAVGSDKSLDQIRSVIHEVYPKGKYRIEQTAK